MTESLFKRIFSYRQRENNSPLENFITEIFAFCLISDEKFRNDFFSLLNLKNNKDFNVETQKEYAKLGRPDIEIITDENIILVEAKVEASERENQLDDYASILTSKKEFKGRKIVVFLTKYFEHKEINKSQIELFLFRWFEIYSIIDNDNKQTTQEFKYFLKENSMDKIKNFTIQDMLAMKTIPETITKMDELLEQFKPEFDKQFGGYSKDSSRSTRLPNSLYINYVQLSYDKQTYHILIGFFWWWGESEVPFVGLSVEIPNKKFDNSDLLKILDAELLDERNWEYEDDGKFSFYSSFKPITDFISNEDEDNIPAMKKYLQSELNELYEIRKKYPKTFKK